VIPGRASRTALRVAYSRAAHQLLDAPPRLLADPVGVPILGPGAPQRIRARAQRFASLPARILRSFLLARSRLAEDTLADMHSHGVRQYVLLGAGLDTFAYRNPWPAALAVFEVDHPATQQWKRSLLAQAAIAVPSSLHFVPLDFERESLATQLHAAAFRRDAPACFAWLGVSMYLSRAAVSDTLHFIAGLPPGSAVVFDYATPPADMSPVARLWYRARLLQLAASGEPWLSFYRPAELATELETLGFTQREDLGPEELNRRYFATRSDGLRCAGPLRLVCARTPLTAL